MNNRSIAGFLSVIFFLTGCGDSGKKGENVELVMFCAAGMKAPVSQIVEQYRSECGGNVMLQFGGSGTLLSNMQIAPGDIYLAADSSYTAEARKLGLIAETMPVALMKAGFGVPKGNPKKLSSLADLKREGIRVGIGNPDAASIGKFTKKILSKHGAWEGLNPTVSFPTVNELANALRLNTVDVAILWDAVAFQYPDVDFVSVPEFEAEKVDVTVAVTKACQQPAEALKFCRYLTAREKGNMIFRENGYEVPDGDSWAENPEILLYSGAMLRPALQDSISEFEKREGVTIRPVYNGCGMLVSQIKAGEKPDAYFSCDQSFLDLVGDKFEKGRVVSANEMVILAEKGNPKSIQSIEDLAKPGIRIGLAHPEKSALGALSKNLLEKEGVYQKIVEAGNLKMESATGDLLVNQIKASSLDAVIVYRSNAMASQSNAGDFAVIGINRPGCFAVQPYAIAKESKHSALMGRFLDSCISEVGKENFLKYGFRWELKDSVATP